VQGDIFMALDDIEDQLAGGADIDSLIMSGDLPVDEEVWGWQVPEPPPLTEEELDELVANLARQHKIDPSSIL